MIFKRFYFYSLVLSHFIPIFDFPNTLKDVTYYFQQRATISWEKLPPIHLFHWSEPTGNLSALNFYRGKKIYMFSISLHSGSYCRKFWTKFSLEKSMEAQVIVNHAEISWKFYERAENVRRTCGVLRLYLPVIRARICICMHTCLRNFRISSKSRGTADIDAHVSAFIYILRNLRKLSFPGIRLSPSDSAGFSRNTSHRGKLRI